jgi:phosphoglycolate phosphatase-like HAD superfamily hydrolase
MIGDKPSDVELGRRCGMAAILVGSRPDAAEACRPDAAVDDLSAAAAWLAAQRSRGGPRQATSGA